MRIKKLNRKNFECRVKENSNKRNEDRIKYCKNIVKRIDTVISSDKKQKKFCKSNFVFSFMFDYVYIIDYFFFRCLKIHLFQKNHSSFAKEHIKIIIILSFINWIIIKNLSP